MIPCMRLIPYSDAETAAREEANIQRMLAMPPEPHKPVGKGHRSLN
jgi:hypothetical protein